MIIDGVLINAELTDVLDELVRQLHTENIGYFGKIKSGTTHVQVTCPYHSDGKERRPSAGIRKSDGVLHCFACGKVASLPEVVSHCFGYDDFGAYGWRWLLKRYAVVGGTMRKGVTIEVNPRRPTPPESLGYVSDEELDRYRYVHPYMYKRGLTDDVISMFDIGYDRDTDCITFPVRDISGNVLLVARRSVRGKYFNYPVGSEKPLYGLYELARYGEGSTVIVCESMLDALSFWGIGKSAVALNGVGNELQFRQLRELPCRSLILATDMDAAGMRARKKIRQEVSNKLIYEYFFPQGRKDANECTKEELKNLQEILI